MNQHVTNNQLQSLTCKSYRFKHMLCETQNIILQISYYIIYISYFYWHDWWCHVMSHDVQSQMTQNFVIDFRTLKKFQMSFYWKIAKILIYDLKFKILKNSMKEINFPGQNFKNFAKFQWSSKIPNFAPEISKYHSRSAQFWSCWWVI